MRPDFYQNLPKCAREEGAATPTEWLRLLPEDHFVWSDDLANAFNIYVDDALGRDNAYESTLGLDWSPALHESRDLIEACPDLSQLTPPVAVSPATEPAYLFRRSKAGAWEIRFAGQPCGPFNDSVGLHYLKHLLQNPSKTLSVLDLVALVQSPVLSDSQQRVADAAKAELLGPDDDTSDDEANDSLRLAISGYAGDRD